MRTLISHFALLVLSIGSLLAASSAVVAQTATVKHVAPAYMSPTSGKEMYIAYCGACHGAQGKGDGPATAALKAKPTNLTQLMNKSTGKFPEARFRDVIAHGTIAAHGGADMPVWGQIFRDLDNDPSVSALRVENLMTYVEVLSFPIH